MKYRSKYLVIIVLSLCAIALIFFIRDNNLEAFKESSNLQVVVSTNQLKEITEKICGENIDVTCIVPSGIEVHDFEPKTKDMKTLVKSDMFIYNGLGLEHWLDGIKKTLNDNSIIMVNASANIDSMTIDGVKDPHVWLSLNEVKKQIDSIKEAIINLDKDNEVYYEKNSSNLIEDINSIINEYKFKFDSLKNRDFITGHAAFGYLARDYNLINKSIQDLNESEPNPKDQERLIKYCKEKNIKVIFSEAKSSSAYIESLAREINAKSIDIFSLEEHNPDMTYLDGMRKNLEIIYKNLL